MARNLRELARGKPCQIRIYGVCNHDPQTTVLAHLRMMGITGIGQKSPDALGAWACSACHDVVDGRVKTDFERDYIRMCFYEGVLRTQAQLIKDEYLIAVVA